MCEGDENVSVLMCGPAYWLVDHMGNLGRNMVAGRLCPRAWLDDSPDVQLGTGRGAIRSAPMCPNRHPRAPSCVDLSATETKP